MGVDGQQRQSRVQRWLWSLYSRCYDGLLDLIPYRRLIDSVVDRLGARPGDRVLDLGCGTGNTTAALVERVDDLQIIGVDSSDDMLRVARTKLGHHRQVRFVDADLLKWLTTAESGSAERIMSVNVLYTMQPSQRAQFWRHAVRVLAPGGRLVVVTTDRAGIGPVIREQTAEKSFLRSTTPRLAAVLAMNMVIWLLETRKVFDPAPAQQLMREAESHGGSVVSSERCYGGPEDGVDVLMVIERALDLTEVIDLRVSDDAPDTEADTSGPIPRGAGER
jgi:ubiquinone/menaquinone biosynthesis C-methylase UbiE